MFAGIQDTESVREPDDWFGWHLESRWGWLLHLLQKVSAWDVY
jgi:hypothetical protein